MLIAQASPNPTAPFVITEGAVIGIKRTPDEAMAWFNRGDVMTAYLLLMDCEPRTHEDAKTARQALVSDYGLDGRKALRCVMAASLLLNHDIEP